MPFAVINDADNAWVSGPVDDAPMPGDGQHVIEVALGYPDVCAWDAAAGGFVDVAPVKTPVAFLKLHTYPQLAALWTLAMTHGEIATMMLGGAASRDGIDLADPEVLGAIDFACALGAYDPAEAARIKAGLPPVTPPPA
ncbi:MAG: hypothetical protein ACRYG4_26150 [Janthinobacterium lividum]